MVKFIQVLIVIAVITLAFGVGHVFGQESIVIPPDRYYSGYYDGWVVGHDSGVYEGYSLGYKTCQWDLRMSSTVTFTDDLRWQAAEPTIFSVEKCIELSIQAANNHARLAYEYKKDIEHNIYWMNLHNSCAYWLDYLTREKP
jgi:hypothetical protein